MTFFWQPLFFSTRLKENEPQDLITGPQSNCGQETIITSCLDFHCIVEAITFLERVFRILPIRENQRVAVRPELVISRSLADQHSAAHSPLRINGSAFPSANTPSMSSSPEPIIQSQWTRL